MRRWIAILPLLGFWSFAGGQVQLAVPNLNSVPGAQLVVPVTISNGSSIVAIQFTLTFDSAVLNFARNTTTSGVEGLADYTVGSHVDGGQVHFIILSGSLSPLSPESYTLLNLIFESNQSAASGYTTPLEISQIQASDAQGRSVSVTGSDGSITFSTEVNVPSEGENQLLFPQFANGEFQGGTFSALLVLVNRTGAAASGIVDLVKSDGSPFSVTLSDGRSDSRFPFEVPAGGSVFLKTNGLGPLSTGYAKISATAPIGGVLIFTMKDAGGKTLSEAGVGASSAHKGFSIPVLYEPPASNTGIAFANPFGEDVEVTLTLKDEEGFGVGNPLILQLPAKKHNPQFASQFFPLLKERSSFKGSIEVSADGEISVIALKQEGLLLTTFPAVKIEQ